MWERSWKVQVSLGARWEQPLRDATSSSIPLRIVADPGLHRATSNLARGRDALEFCPAGVDWAYSQRSLPLNIRC
jgi:hypothetical protein